MPVITALNGQIPADRLTVVDTGPNGPQQLLAIVAPIWAAMLAAGMPAGCLRSGYRTLAQQAAEVAAMNAGLTPAALPPGQSVHGEGLAADIDEPARTWAHAHAGEYGLRFPLTIEPWHCELDQAHLSTVTPAPPAPVQQEDTMRIISAPLPWAPNTRQQVYVTDAGGAGTIDDATAAVLRQSWPSHDYDSWDKVETEVEQAWARHAAASAPAGQPLDAAAIAAAAQAGATAALANLTLKATPTP